MKFFKGFLSFIIGIILTILLMVLSLNMIFKNVVEKEVLGGIIKDQIISEYIENEEIENKDLIKELLNENEVTTIAGNVIDEYMEFLEDNNHKVSQKTLDSIINFSVKHRQQISKIAGRDISENELKSAESYKNLSDSINEGFSKVGNEINKSGTKVVKTYNNLTSNNFKIIIIISILISIILLMVIKNSFYKWLSIFSKSIITCSIIIISLYVLSTFLINKIKENQNIEITISLNGILVIGIIELVIGILCIIIKKIIDKKENIKQTKYIEKSHSEEMIMDSKNELEYNNQSEDV